VYVIATFEHSLFLELAITSLEQNGISNHQILAIPLDRRQEERRLFDTIHRADGFSLLDVAAVLGTCGMLLGCIYGFEFKWGPILWGIIGLVVGAGIGLVGKLLYVKRQTRRETKQRQADVVLIIYCHNNEQTNMIEHVLWDNTALGVAKYQAKPNELH
jgi:hypothetical protein